MTILSGLIIVFSMLVVLEFIERIMPTTYLEGVPIFTTLIILMAVMIGWQLNEHVVTRWLGDTYSTGVISRILQITHATMAGLIAYRGFGIGVVITLLILLMKGLEWILFG